MSLSVERRLRVTRDRIATVRGVLFRAVIGTRHGLVVFLGALLFVGFYWRLGVFITDNTTLANTLVSLAEGQLAVDEAVYSESIRTPGIYVEDGEFYGRNYGQLVVALGIYRGLQGLTLVADPGIVFAAAWSLLVVALGRETGRVIDRRSLGTSLGAVCGVLVFAANVAVARPLADRLLLLAALQLSAILATAMAAVLLYRLLARMYGTRTGVVAAAGLVAATPVGFWASIPKRHVYAVALFLGVCYAFYRSREPADPDSLLSPVGFRALAYSVVGLTTWLHPGEAFVFFLALVAVDVPTAKSNDVRSLSLVAGAFALSLVPFLVTNVLVSGDPFRPPRLLTSSSRSTTRNSFTGGGAPSTGGGGPILRTAISAVTPSGIADPLVTGLERWQLLLSPFPHGARTVVEDPEALFRTFVRAGHVEGVTAENHGETIETSVVEAGPVVAALATAVTTAVLGVSRAARRLRRTGLDVRADFWSGLRRFRSSATGATDVFVALTGIMFLLVYIQRLPIHAQVTVRYLLLLYPVGIYGIARQRPLRRALAAHGRTGLWTYCGGVLLGAQVFVVVVAVGGLGLGEAIQVHALVGLAVALALGASAAASAATDRVDRLTAVLLGLAAALGTDFLVLSGLVYFQYGQYALPAVGELARAVSIV